MKSAEKLWQFIRTALEIGESTKVIDARLSVVGRLTFCDSVRIEQAHPDVEYDVLIIDRKGFFKYKNNIPSLNVKSVAYLSDKDAGTEQSDVTILRYFYDELHASSDLSFDLSSFGAEYNWLFVFRLDQSQSAVKEEGLKNSNKHSEDLVPKDSFELPDVEREEDIFSAVKLVNFDLLHDCEKPIVEGICKHINSYLRDSLTWYWKLGEYVSRLKSAVEKAGLNFKERMAVLAGMLGNKTVRTLYKAKQVYDRWDKEEFKQLVDKRGDKGVISFRHLLALSRIDDDEAVNEYVDKVVNEGISARDLEVMLKGKGGLARGKGPELELPQSIEGRLSKLYRQLAPLSKTVSALCDDEDFIKCLLDMEADDYTYGLLKNIETEANNAIEGLQTIVDAVSKLLAR